MSGNHMHSSSSPNAGQFKKGQSGNPKGRPKKKPAETILKTPEARHPLRAALRQEASRKVTITDANGSHDIPTREAVLRRLSLKAMSGGPGSVLAARTFLTETAREEERYHQEQKEDFQFWLDYRDRKRDQIAQAIKAGKTPPDPIPHPEDLEFDHYKLEVKFLGAMDQQGRDAENVVAWALLYNYEMGLYWDIYGYGPTVEDGKIVGVNVFMAMYLVFSARLPPRLRKSEAELNLHVDEKLKHGLSAWSDDLAERSKAMRLAFLPWSRKTKIPILRLVDLGLTPYPAPPDEPPTRKRRLTDAQRQRILERYAKRSAGE